MRIEPEFVELLETHAEMSVHDRIVRKRFTLVFHHLSGDDGVWLPLTLEPGQELLSSNCRWFRQPETRLVFLHLPARGPGARSELFFETLEALRPEDGLLRVETFTSFRGEGSTTLVRRTVTARIESKAAVLRVFSPTHPVSVERTGPRSAVLRLDVAGEASRGRFRFFYELAETTPAPELPPEALRGEVGREASIEPPADVVDRDFVEPRRFRPRRRPSLRRLP
jgi:hypothetical protein